MKKFTTFNILLFFILTAPSYAADRGQSIKIIVTSQGFDYDSPWQKKSISHDMVFGCVLPGNRILTTAYSLTDHVLIEVTKPGESRKYTARVIVKDYHRGLALLTTIDKSFFTGLKPVSLAEKMRVLGKRAIVRKWDSLGAEKAYAAEAVKSSIRLYEPHCPVLMHIMTTTMKSGGNGEPIFIDGKLVGVSTGLNTKSRTLYVISSVTINRMLSDLADGAYSGAPYFWMDSNSVSGNENLRSYLGMKQNETGVYISEIPHTSSGGHVLKGGDVILSIDGTKISDDGMYLDANFGRLNFYGLISMEKFVGETVSMKILRNKKRIPVSFKLKPTVDKNFVLPPLNYDRQPRYIMYGGLVIQEFNPAFLKTWGSEWKKKANTRLLFYYSKYAYTLKNGKQRLVVMNRVLPSPCNEGYEYKQNLIMKSLNGTEIKSIPQLHRLLTYTRAKYLVFKFIGGVSIVLDRMEVKKYQKKILKIYNINKSSFIK